MRFVLIPNSSLTGTLTPKQRRGKRISAPARGRGYKWPDVLEKPVPADARASKWSGSMQLLSTSKNSCDYAMAYRVSYAKNKKRLDRPRKVDRKRGKMTGVWDDFFDNYWDGTGMARVRVFGDGTVKVLSDSVTPVGDHLEDSRLVAWNKQLYIQYTDLFTGWEPDNHDVPDVKGTTAVRCNWGSGKSCFSIGMVPVKLTRTGFKTTGPAKLACQNITTGTEKNWAFIENYSKTEMVFQYSMSPLRFLKSKPNAAGLPVSCKTVNPGSSDFFTRLHKYVGPDVIPPAAVSGIACTSPLVNFDKDHWIGAGHYKVSYKYFDPQSRKNVHKFIGAVGRRLGLSGVYSNDWFKHHPSIHPGYIYCMFLYTVNKKTLQLGKLSEGFLPQNPEFGYFSTIFFPMGIQPHLGKSFMVSMGVSDTDCAALILKKSEIDAMLKYTNRTKPKDYGFSILDVTNPLAGFSGK